MNPATPIDDSYWVIPNRLLAGEYPGQLDELAARRKVQSFLDAGVTAFIDLTEAGERGLKPYDHLLQSVRELDGGAIVYRRTPIQDLGIPSSSKMSEMLALINELLDSGKVIYVHCWGGIGRTGTVVGCFMVEKFGINGLEALQKIKRFRDGTPDGWRISPETPKQRDMVLQWKKAQRF